MTPIGMILAVVLYLLAVGYLGYRGFRNTASATDYLLAGRKTHPYIMAMSYGATFISTSAIVGSARFSNGCSRGISFFGAAGRFSFLFFFFA